MEIDPNHFILTTSGGIKQMQQFPIILSVINRNFMYKVFIFSFSVKWHLSDVFNLFLMGLSNISGFLL